MGTINLQPRYGHSGSPLNVIIKYICNEIKIFLSDIPHTNSVFANKKSYIKSHAFAIIKPEIDFL